MPKSGKRRQIGRRRKRYEKRNKTGADELQLCSPVSSFHSEVVSVKSENNVPYSVTQKNQSLWEESDDSDRDVTIPITKMTDVGEGSLILKHEVDESLLQIIEEKLCDENIFHAFKTATDKLQGGTHSQDPPLIDTTPLFEQAKEYLTDSLPSQWSCLVSNGFLHVMMLAKSNIPLIQRSISVSPKGEIFLTVHAQRLSENHDIFRDIPTVELTAESVHDFGQNVREMADAFGRLKICRGVEEFKNVWNDTKECDIDENPFKETSFSITCRSTACDRLVSGFNIKRCVPCNNLCKVLQRRFVNSAVMTASKSNSQLYQSSLEAVQRLREEAIALAKLKRRNRLLEERISKLALPSYFQEDILTKME